MVEEANSPSTSGESLVDTAELAPSIAVGDAAERRWDALRALCQKVIPLGQHPPEGP